MRPGRRKFLGECGRSAKRYRNRGKNNRSFGQHKDVFLLMETLYQIQ
jgi:hypothetical protein